MISVSASGDEARYYEIDSALNLAMAAQRDLLEASRRLGEMEAELEEVKKKVLFLQRTRRVSHRVFTSPIQTGVQNSSLI